MLDHIGARIAGWRTGSRGSQVYVLCVLLALVAATAGAGWFAFDQVPLTLWFVWLLLGMLLLRFVPLLFLSACVVASVVAVTFHGGIESIRLTLSLVSLALALGLILYQASRQRSGLPVVLSEALLAQLRDRLQGKGVVPQLPDGWRSHSLFLTAHGTRYAGDFLVADLQAGRYLVLVLVDVSGKGLAVGPQTLQLSGALGGLISALPPVEMMRAANSFLMRQDSEESFATAVHVLVDLETGEYMITSAGHPPALHWNVKDESWDIDQAQGTALGVIDDPDLEPSQGVLAPGEALMFYTDGVVELRDRDLDHGIDWLRKAAREAVQTKGFDEIASRVLRKVPRGQDDRAMLVLERLPAGGPRVRARGRTAALPDEQSAYPHRGRHQRRRAGRPPRPRL